MANTKISAFTAETDVANITGFAAYKTVSGTSTNVRISGSEIESTLNLDNFAVGTLAVGRGGTGQTSYTDGQLLIGNTGNTLTKATLTQGTDLSITNGNGSISIGHAAVSNTPATNNTTLSAGGTFTAINSVTVSAQGHLTAQNTETYTLPSAPTGANPSVAISGTVVNGSASTFMRSDAVPALGSTITIGTGGSTRGLVDIQGGNNLDAQLRLNCSAGTHAVVIEGPDHLSGSANYIVKLPHEAPAVNKILKVGTYAANAGTYADPSLATMIWADAGNTVTESFIIAASDETTDLTTGTGKATFRMPYAFTLTGVRASVSTAPAGSVITVDINEAGTSILSTKITIDAGEKTSTTAATAPVISDSALADDAEITIDIDTIGSSTAGTGLKVTLIGNQ
tara:strand:- start:157 stop:1350 length:1194 start_codon:yes stop_codon:yes gene_type:complete